MHPNIEKSSYRPGEFIGYCNGCQSIRRGGQGWETYRLASAAGAFTYATAGTLFELGGKLAHIAANTRADLLPGDRAIHVATCSFSDAAFIVRACNAHAGLVAALEAILTNEYITDAVAAYYATRSQSVY